MKKLLLMAPVLLLITTFAQAQSAANAPVTSTARPTESRFQAFRTFVASRAVYPLIKSSKYSGVVPVEKVNEKPDTNLKYKLLMDISTGIKDNAAAKEINDGLAEVARAINTHIAAGVPKNNLEVVVVVHGGALKSFYNSALYKEKYQIDNPNTVLFQELQALGVKFTACGQSMAFQNITQEQLVPWLKTALSAQIPISTYQLKGYVYKKIETE
ncbi:DsrE family protein [Adhaeribacter radiodurans]|uniref:DsrE family protein n=1 Tax=Adhaeribacter radiodurans TaxID=2745197 RepID=A0A7L7LCP4_9BACT|nr:DsrE family protein [Adhaeribacter radiodurans]QMU30616.1 DsrE family protein [Adhaeribacter radiodurans]